MADQHSNDSFRERTSGLAVTSTIIVGIALGLQIAGVATDYWITTITIEEIYATAGLWKECLCIKDVCACKAVKVICAVTLLVVFGDDDGHYYNWTSRANPRPGYSFGLCAVAAGLIAADVVIGIVDINRRRPTTDNCIARPRARRDGASDMRQNDMVLENRGSVQQHLSSYNYVDRQRLDMRQNDMALDHRGSVKQQLPTYNHVDRHRFDMRQNDMTLDHRGSVQQHPPNYNYVDRQRFAMRQNDMALDHRGSVQQHPPNYNYVDRQRFDMRKNDMALDHRGSVQQHPPNYNYIDRQRLDMRQNYMALEHDRGVHQQLPEYNYVDTHRFDMRRY